MKTPALVLTVLFSLAAPVALQASDKKASRTEVVFSNPEKFADVKDTAMDTEKGRNYLLGEIREFITQRADATLPAGYMLSITFTDIDLAGAFEPWRGPQLMDVRIVKAIYPPSFEFNYKITNAAGQTVASGNETLRDLTFDMRITSKVDDPLRYEKDILGDWIRSKVAALKR